MKNYISEYSEYKIKADDILKIDVVSDNPETALPFNPDALSTRMATNKDALLFNGYQVNSDGFINFPTLGKLKVSNITISELREMIYKQIKDGGYLVNPNVDIKLINAHFTILGEVNKPGRYEFIKNNLNILEAIGTAGDLTINGVRNNIKLIRDNNGKKLITYIDLTKSDFLAENSYQVFSGDIIIVNPNSTRIKNAGIIGNSGTLLSLFSFILSSIIVISNSN